MASDEEDLSGHVLSERAAAHVLLIRFARDEKKNALHSSMIIELGRLLDAAAEDDTIRCVILTGGIDAFAAGADIREMVARGTAGTSNNPRRVAAWRRIEQFRKPLIAAVNGIAFGAGNELAMVCDFVIAGTNAMFGQPEVKIGGMAGDGGTQRLPRKVGAAFAAYMLFTGNPIDAETARQLGYVVEICDPADTVRRAVEVAALIATRAPIAVRLTKACIRVAVGATLENGIAYERDSIWRNAESPDRREGMTAFIEKRPPQFRGTW